MPQVRLLLKTLTFFQSVSAAARVSGSLFLVATLSSCGQVKNDVKAVTAGASGGSASTPRILSFADGATVNLGSIAVGGTYFLRLPISSTGSGNATVTSSSNSSSYFTFNGGSFPGTGGTCTTPISGNCSIAILFTAPTTAAGIGSYSDSLVVQYTSGGTARSISITLSAAVSAGASLSINSGTPYDFGSKTIGTSTDKSLTITNSGGLNALDMVGSGLSAPIIFKGGTYPGTGGTCGTSLASGASCTVVTTFTPTASVLSSKTLSMSYTVSGVTNTATLGVSGTGVTLASVSISSPAGNPYDYGNVTIGASASDATFTFSNSGGQSATSFASGGISAPFTFKGGTYPGTGGTCGTSLASGASCTMVVSFLPTSAGLASATLSTTYDNGSGSTQTLSRPIQGTGLTPASLSISDGTTYDYGSQVLTTNTNKTFTVTNSGGTSATSLSATALVAPYTFASGSYPGGGTCGATLAAAATCTIIVRFTPTSAVVSTDTLTLGYNNGVGTVSTTRPLTGTGISPASLTINGGVAYGFGSKNVGSSTDQTLTVSNSGSAPATAMSASGLSAPFVFKGGSYPGTGGTCGLTLAASASCTVVVTYSPTAAGLITQTLSISYNDGATTTSDTDAISGTGVALASLSITSPVASPYDFGSVTIGATPGSVTLTYSNGGGQSATSISENNLSAPFSYKGGFYPGTGGTCGTSLAASATCTVVVDFTPSSSGLATATLTLSYNDGSGSTQSLSRPIKGTGVTTANLTISDGATYDFGSKPLTGTTSKTFTVTNSGGSNATSVTPTALSAPFAFVGGTYPGTGGTCGGTINSGSSCTLIIVFSPVAASTFTDTISLSFDNGATTVSATRPITGTGLNQATLTINNSVDYDFGNRNVGSSTDQTLTVSNTGDVSATSLSSSGFSAPILFKGGSYPGTGGTCGLTLAASGTCTIVVTYSPVAAGLLTRTLTLSYNNGVIVTSATNAISGTGIALASLSITNPVASPYDFGTIVIGGTAGSVTLTYSNGGGQSATSLSANNLSSPFSYKGGFYPGTGGTCGTTLAAAATCTVVVDFTPSSAGVATTTLTMSYNDGSTTVNLSKNLQGTGATPASLSLSDGATYDYGSKVLATNTDHTFTLTNSGGSSATSLSATALVAPYSFPSGFPGGGTCGATLAAGANCTIIVRFSPVAGGTFTDTLDISYNSGATTTSTTRSITGLAGSTASLAINGGVAYDFGTKTAGTSTDYSLTVNNSGGLPATSISASGLSAPINYKGGTYPGTGGTCGTSLSNGSSCTIIVTFAPTTNAVSSKTLSLSYHNASATVNSTLVISGTGVTLASIAVSSPVASPFSYGSVTVGAAGVDQAFILTNSGGQSATSLTSGSISAPFTFKGGSYPGTGGNCGATLAASASCTMVVTFLPSSPITSTTTLVTTYDDGSGSTITLNQGLSGTGISTALLAISESGTYDYGSRTVGTTLDHTFTVTNSGGTSATSIVATALSAPFTFKGGTYPGTGGTCGATLAGSGTTCSIVVRFSPVAVGGFSDTIDLSYSDGTTTLNTTRSVSGTGGSVANLTISDGATYSFGSVAKNYTSDKTFTVTNSGSATASSMAGAALAAPYTYKGGTYPGTGGTCGTSLGAAGTCTVVITFSPTAAASYTDTFTLNYNDSVAAASTSRALDGTGATISKIVGGGSHTCALYNTGIVKCWGSDFSGQLGNGGANTDSLSPVTVSGISTAVDIAAGTDHTCAVLANGRAKCWGSDAEGQLGNDASLTDQGSPALIATVTDFILISAGGNLTCGLRSGGTVVCFGSDAEGGNGNDASFTDNATPVTVSGLTGATDISVGRAHACARKSDDTVRCWGANLLGQLGNASNTSIGTPVTPAPGTANSSAAGGDVSCSILSGGSVKCWGSDDNGQLGDDVTLAAQNTPVTIGGLANSASLALGMKHGCAKTSGNAVTCWGDDFYGQLGDNASTTDEATPVSVSGLASVSIIGVGEYHSCAVLSSGSAYCWGANSSGQLGNVSPLVQQATPVLVNGL